MARDSTCDAVSQSYGHHRHWPAPQIMSVFAIIPPLLATCELIIAKKLNIKAAIRQAPRYLFKGFMFLVFGDNNSWEDHNNPGERPAQSAIVPSNGFWQITLEKFLYPLSFILTLLDVVWIWGYVRGGSIPNPRTPVNNPHEAWKPFSVALYMYGYCVCCVNLLAWTNWLDQRAERKRRQRRSNPYVQHAESLESPKLRRVLSVVTTACILFGEFITSAGPVFAPPSALPLAQQWQWTHFCANHDFPSYAILDAAGANDKTSIVKFYLNNHRERPTYRLTILEGKEDPPLLLQPDSMEYAPTGAFGTLPAYNVTYYAKNSFSATCTLEGLPPPSNSSIAPNTCATGYHSPFSTKSGLTITLKDETTGLVTTMNSVDVQWLFKDDAPSLELVLDQSSNQKSGDNNLPPVLQTSVTRRNHCEQLKVCMSSPTLDLQSIVAMGLILRAQQDYSSYCLQPRIYSI